MTLTEQVIEALKIDFDEVYQVGYEQGYADASNGTTSSFVGYNPIDTTDEVEQIIDTLKVELDEVYQAGYEKGYAEGSGGSDENILFYDDFESGLDNLVFIQGSTVEEDGLKLEQDAEHGAVVYCKYGTKNRYIQFPKIDVSNNIQSVSVSFYYKVDATSTVSGSGLNYVQLLLYSEDGTETETQIQNDFLVDSQWHKCEVSFDIVGNYKQILLSLYSPRTHRKPYWLDDIKITY